MGIKHASPTIKPDDPAYDVSADEWNENHTIDGDVLPDADDSHDLGSAVAEFKDGYFDGVVYADTLDVGAASAVGMLVTGPTLVVAASNSNSVLRADYECDGAADDVQINAALGALPAQGGRVVLLEGTFTLADPITIPDSAITLEGQGYSSFLDGDGLANNEHCIVISGKTDVTIRNLSMQTEDGGGKTSHCIFIEDGSDRFTVTGVTFVNFDMYGIRIEGTNIVGGLITNCVSVAGDDIVVHVNMDGANYLDYIVITNNIFRAVDIGIYFIARVRYSTLSFNVIHNARDGIKFRDCDYGTMNGNVTFTMERFGISAESSTYVSIGGNVCTASNFSGLKLENCTYCTITGNVSYNNLQHGITFEGADNNAISGNVCMGNDRNNSATYDGIFLNSTADDNLVIGNHCTANDRNGIQSDGDRNTITGNFCADNGDYGIEIAATADANLTKNNRLYNNTVGSFLDSGTNTRMHVKTFPFTGGTTFLSADGAAWGYEIDANTECAIITGALPPETQLVVRWKIKAVTLLAEADAMRLEIDAYGGTDNEVLATEVVDVADHPSETTNFAGNDYIYWIVDAGDDADVGHMIGDDTVMIKVQHEAAGGADCETDAVFQCIEIHYV